MMKPHQTDGQQPVSYVFSRTHGLTEDFELRPIAHETRSAPRRDRIRHVNWELPATWSLVVFCFSALLYCLYVIRAKCQVTPPF